MQWCPRSGCLVLEPVPPLPGDQCVTPKGVALIHTEAPGDVCAAIAAWLPAPTGWGEAYTQYGASIVTDGHMIVRTMKLVEEIGDTQLWAVLFAGISDGPFVKAYISVFPLTARAERGPRVLAGAGAF